MPLILGANSVSGYTVKNSLRFNGDSADYLNRTLGTSTSRRIYTMSAWIKRSKLDVYGHIFTFGPNPGSWDSLRFDNDNKLSMRINNDTYVLQTSQLFRDVSAWYHVVVAIDTAQTTSSNRVKMYVNGSEVTAFTTSSYPTQNYDTSFTSGNVFRIGVPNWNTTQNIDSYLSEAYIIDGQALTPSSFGETDTLSGIWIPKSYSGSFGTNGFFLKFADSASLGTDSSGNGNTFTVNNLTSVDQSTDTPTNNFATLNPLANFRAGATLTEGNLKASLTTTKAGVPATVGVSTGKWYWENKIDTLPVDGRFGIGIVPFEPVEADDFYNANNKGIGLSGFNSIIYASGTGIDDFYGNATGRWSGFTGIIGVALDLSSGTKTIAMSRDGAWITGSNTTDSVFANALKVDITSYVNAYDFWNPIIGSSNGSSTTGVISLNFGSPSFTIASGNTDGAGFGNFEYAVPSGYYSLNTKNLANFG